MKRVIVAGSLAVASLAFACVDLFHSTKFDTLCDIDASAAECGQIEAGVVPDASEPPPHYDSCKLSSADVKRLSSKVCLWLGACVGPIGDSTYGGCTVKADLAYDCNANPNLRPRAESDAFWSCLANEGNGPKSCADVEACVFTKARQQCGKVTTGSFRGCDINNNARVECQAGSTLPTSTEPCAMSGRHCVVAAGDMDSFCVSTTASTLPPTAPGCKGTSAQITGKTDNANIDKGVDCALVGNGKCVGTTTPVCEGTGDAGTCSTASGTVTCVGNVATTCASSKTVTLDCDALGYDCSATAANAAVLESACIPRDDAGAPCTDGSDTCESDNTLVSCALGQKTSIKCIAAGFGPCVLRAHGGFCTAP